MHKTATQKDDGPPGNRTDRRLFNWPNYIATWRYPANPLGGWRRCRDGALNCREHALKFGTDSSQRRNSGYRNKSGDQTILNGGRALFTFTKFANHFEKHL